MATQKPSEVNLIDSGAFLPRPPPLRECTATRPSKADASGASGLVWELSARPESPACPQHSACEQEHLLDAL